jgi:hypothetical protein
MTKLPRDLWKHIRSFSGDRGTEPTPSAKLMQEVIAIDDTTGDFLFAFGRDGYASTVHLAPANMIFFHRGGWPYRDPSYFRILHMEYDGDTGGGWPILARSLE